MSKVHTLTRALEGVAPGRAVVPAAPEPSHWREALPTLSSPLVTLREAVRDDAVALFTALPEGTRDLLVADGPPSSVMGFESLIDRLQRARRTGTMACWTVVPTDGDAPIGFIGLRSLDHAATLVEGVAVLADEFRGSGLFHSAARLVLGCAFDHMRVHRIEFRVDVRNGRANGALRKLGALQEGVLRRARYAEGDAQDQVLWAMLASDWSGPGPRATSSIH